MRRETALVPSGPHQLPALPRRARPSPAVDPFPKWLVAAGFLVCAAFFGGFAAWAINAPIKSAVIAPGVVSVDSYRKRIQHLEGGIVDRILVKDGDIVTSGQVLLSLRKVAPTASVDQLKAQYYDALAAAARLGSERDGLNAVRYPAELADKADDAAVKAAIAGQDLIFNSRRALLSDRLSVIGKQISQTQEEVAGLKGQLNAMKQQAQIVREEFKDSKSLFDKYLITKRRFLEIKRNRAQIQGRRSELVAMLAARQQKILELELKRTELKAAVTTNVVEDLRMERARAHEFSLKLTAAEDMLSRTDVRSPIDGTVVKLQVHTKNGVVSPGQPIMEIVPSDDKLVVEARVRPEDIDEVRPGLEAHVILKSLNRRDRRPITGVLINVSADRLTDRNGGNAYYGVRVQLDPVSIEHQGLDVLAGMGADVFIQTGERTPLQYLAAPIVRTFQHGFREY